MITIEPVNVSEAAVRLSKFSGKLELATSRAIRRTLKGARQSASRKVASRYTIGSRAVMSTVSVQARGFEGEMKSRGSVIMLDRFRVRPKRRPRKMPAGGVRAEVVRGQGGQLRSAFLQRSGGVYERAGASRYPLRRIAGPSAPGMLSSPEVSRFIESRIEERFGVEFTHEAEFILGSL